MEKTDESVFPDLLQSIGICLLLIFFILLSGGIQSIINGYIDSELSSLLGYVFGVGIPLYIVHHSRRKYFAKYTYNINFAHYRIIPMLMAASIGILIISGAIANLFPISETMKAIVRSTVVRKGAFTFIAFVLVAPIFEEIIFRGIILDGLIKIYTPLKAIIISSCFFSVVHLNPIQGVVALAFGIFSGWIFYNTHNLLLSIIIHMTTNLFGFVLRNLYAPQDVLKKNSSELFTGTLSWLIFTISAITIACTIIYLNKYFSRSNLQKCI
jgi:uncharacterized protein